MFARTRSSALLLFVAVCVAGAPAGGGLAAQEGRPFTAEDALNVRTPSIGETSPDGRWALLTVQTHRDRLNVDHGRFGDPTYIAPSTHELVLLDTETGAERPLLEGRVQTRGATWSPDGRRLALLVLDGDRYRLHLMDGPDGGPRPVELRTALEIASDSPLEWRPDGSGLLLTLRPEGWRERARQAYLEMSEGPVIVQDSGDPFLDWERVRNLGDEAIPAVVDLTTGQVEALLPAASWADLEQSADGRFVSALRQVPLKTVYEGSDGSEWSLLRVEVQTGDTLRLVEPTTDRIRPDWSPDGDRWAWSEDGDVLVRSITGDSARNLTARHREADEGEVAGEAAAGAPGGGGDEASGPREDRVRYSVMRWSPDGSALLVGTDDAWHLLDAADGDLHTVFELEEDEEARPRRSVQEWSPDGRHLYVATSERDRWERGLARLELETGEMETLVADANTYGSWTLSEDGGRWLWEMSDGDRPDDVWAAGPDLDEPRRLTDLNPWLDGVKLTRSELVEYLDVDGNRLYGILYYPVDYEPGRRYPLVAEIYEDFFDNGFNHRMNLVASQGWFGFRPSVELEEGYPGEAWLKGVTAGINTLMDRGLVDGDRLGVHGTSYGGYAVNLLVTQTDRFAAAINISGKVNIISFLGDSPKITTRNYRAAESGQDRIGATLWEQPQKYVAHSAVMFADRIDTPLLLLSGEGDWNVPATNQREMYYALRRLGKEVVWVHYMNAGHGAGRAGTESDFHDHWGRILGWYRDHFDEVGEVAADPEGAAGPGGR